MVASKDMQIRYLLANILVISLSIAFLAHFGSIVYYGAVIISEPRSFILALEIIGLIVFVVFASLNLVK